MVSAATGAGRGPTAPIRPIPPPDIAPGDIPAPIAGTGTRPPCSPPLCIAWSDIPGTNSRTRRPAWTGRTA